MAEDPSALGLRDQSSTWSWAYAVFAVLCGAAAIWVAHIRLRTRQPALLATAAPIGDGQVPRTHLVLWIVLPALASLMLLASTSQLSFDIAVVPFLWILPLTIYLLSFILVFDSDRWYWLLASRNPRLVEWARRHTNLAGATKPGRRWSDDQSNLFDIVCFTHGCIDFAR